jgi:hypothetical protein
MRTLATSDEVWSYLYRNRWSKAETVPDEQPAAGAGAQPIAYEFVEDAWLTYADRHLFFSPGDHVEAQWRGSFNLVANEIVTSYDGLSWWSAVIVARDDATAHYKIHYHHWDSGVWDEWIPRSKIR